jgi:PilZ domain-containing protein
LEDRPVETTLYSLADSPPKPPERRSSERYLSLLRVGTLMIGDRRELCLIRNISAGGMMIRAYSAIPTGTALTIELKQGDPVAGTAQWNDDGLTGVTFDQPIDVLALLTPSGDAPRPRMPRIELDCTAWVREGADVRRTRAVNISQGGLCVATPLNLTVRAEVAVTVIGLAPIAGLVKWKDGVNYGIGFNRVLALGDLVTWLQSQQHYEHRRRAAG